MKHETKTPAELLKRGLQLEYFTLCWNVIGIFITSFAAIKARSIAIGGFGLDSLLEIGASTVVIWELTNTKENVRPEALRLIGASFYAIAFYILIQVMYLFFEGSHPHSSVIGIVWTAITLVVMLALAKGKRIVGTALNNPVLLTEGKVTTVDAYLAGSVMIGLAANALFHLWWADLAAALVIVFYGVREGKAAFSEAKLH